MSRFIGLLPWSPSACGSVSPTGWGRLDRFIAGLSEGADVGYFPTVLPGTFLALFVT